MMLACPGYYDRRKLQGPFSSSPRLFMIMMGPGRVSGFGRQKCTIFHGSCLRASMNSFTGGSASLIQCLMRTREKHVKIQNAHVRKVPPSARAGPNSLKVLYTNMLEGTMVLRMPIRIGYVNEGEEEHGGTGTEATNGAVLPGTFLRFTKVKSGIIPFGNDPDLCCGTSANCGHGKGQRRSLSLA